MPNNPALLSSLAEARGQQREVRLMGTSAKYWVYPAKGKAKGTIVFVHGFRGSHDGLHAIIGALEDFDCIAPDLPGYGLSEPIKPKHDLPTYSIWLGEFISSLNLKSKPDVVGHSFGTLVVSAHAAHANDMASVVLINPVSKPGLQGPRRFTSALTEFLFWVTSKMPERGSRFFIDSWPVIQFVSSVMTKSRERDLRNWVHQQHHSTMKNYANSNVMYESYHASIHHCVEEFAPKIENHTLMIAGQRDDITSAKQQLEVSMKLPDARLVVIPKVGHLVHYECSGEAAALIREFLTEGK